LPASPAIGPSETATIFGTQAVSPPNANWSPQQREQRANGYADRVKTQVANIESGSEEERNVKFLNERPFTTPPGYFSGGLLSAGLDPNEKIPVTFYRQVGIGRPQKLDSAQDVTYEAWEIAAGRLRHDAPERGGSLNFQSMRIPDAARAKVQDLESIGKTLQDRWKQDVAQPMTDGPLAVRSGKADAYTVGATLRSLKSDEAAFGQLSEESRQAIDRTLQQGGQVIVPNVYGYPVAGLAFVPYTQYDPKAENRPNRGLMVDLNGGAVSEISGDDSFAHWAATNRDTVLRGFNAEDRQGGGQDAHWPRADDVLDFLIDGGHHAYYGYSTLVSDTKIPVRELFNFTKARDAGYRLQSGHLGMDDLAFRYQFVNSNHARSENQTEVFDSTGQNWKAAKAFWGKTFGYVPVVGSVGNIAFGVHDGLTGMTAQDRAGGYAAAALAGLQLAHDLAQGAAGSAAGRPHVLPGPAAAHNFGWKFNPDAGEFRFRPTDPAAASFEPYAVTGVKPPDTMPASGVFTQGGKLYQGGAGHSYIQGNDGLVYEVKNVRSAQLNGTGYGSVDVVDSRNPDAPKKATLYRAPGDSKWRAQDDVGLPGGGKFSQLFAQKYRAARHDLDAVASGPKRPEDLTEAQREQFANDLVYLVGHSNAEGFPEVNEYTHADSAAINTPLREGHSTPQLQNFLDEFNRLNGYSGPAYRAAYVTPEGAARLRGGVGAVFADPGVQSASTQLVNVHGWGETWAPNVAPGSATQKVMYVFDESVSKKNLSSSFLKDHVAVPPGTPLQALAVTERDGLLYVYMGAPTKLPDHVYDLFTGARDY
jgi:hypothetical protein